MNLFARLRRALHFWQALDGRLSAHEIAVAAQLKMHEQTLAELQQQQAAGQRRADTHHRTIETLVQRLEHLNHLQAPADPPFAWQAPPPVWLERAEQQVGRPVAALSNDERHDAFYTYYSEIGGDHRPILHRQYETYLPWLSAACAHTAGRILDIGCGAGEFLQWLGARGLPAVGIDLSATEVARAQAAGLQVVQADARRFLQAPAESYAAITLFQVIEHVPQPHVMPLLEACAHALLPGGVLLVETVNLRHPLALNGFYTDPTHQTPLPDNYLSFLLQWLGHVDVQLVYTFPDFTDGITTHDPARHYHNYTVIGRRPWPPSLRGLAPPLTPQG